MDKMRLRVMTHKGMEEVSWNVSSNKVNQKKRDPWEDWLKSDVEKMKSALD